jgi:hypothetical protein
MEFPSTHFINDGQPGDRVYVVRDRILKVTQARSRFDSMVQRSALSGAVSNRVLGFESSPSRLAFVKHRDAVTSYVAIYDHKKFLEIS